VHHIWSKNHTSHFRSTVDDVELPQGDCQQDSAGCDISRESMVMIPSFLEDCMISTAITRPDPIFFTRSHLQERVFHNKPRKLTYYMKTIQMKSRKLKVRYWDTLPTTCNTTSRCAWCRLKKPDVNLLKIKQGMCHINITTFCSSIHDLQLNIWILFYENHPVSFR